MKKIMTILACVVLTANLLAQDQLYKKDGTELQTKVVEISDQVVKYKLFDRQDGPLYSISRDEVFMIIYENGRKEIFQTPVEQRGDDLRSDKKKAADKKNKSDKKKQLADKKPVKAPKVKGIPSGFKKQTSLGLMAGVSGVTSFLEYQGGGEPPVTFRPAYAGGLLLDMELSRVFSLHFGLYYKEKGYKIDAKELVSEWEFPEGVSVQVSATGEGDIIHRVHYGEIPLLAVFNFNPDQKTKLQFGVGPFVGIGLAGQEKEDMTVSFFYNDVFETEEVIKRDRDIAFVNTLNKQEEDPDKVYLRRLDYGGQAYLGVKLRPFIFGLTTSVGLANVYPDWGVEDLFTFDPGKKMTTFSTTFSVTYLLF